MATVSQPLKWHGGKRYLAQRIIDLMPPHIHYVEPYFGGGAVLFRKPCEGVSEVVSDLNGDLVNFWQVLADEDLFPRFVRTISATPFCEDIWRSVKLPTTMRPMDRAVAFFVRYRQSRQGLGKDFATVVRTRTRRGMNDNVSAWLSAVEGLPQAHERLKRVLILNRPALDVIRQQDGPETLFYLDPPYLHETRSSKGEYGKFEMSKTSHVELLHELTMIKGKFILSGYPSKTYDTWAECANWRRVGIEIDNKASSRKTKATKTECLWMNF